MSVLEVRQMEELPELLKKKKEKDWNYESGKVFSSMCTSPLEKSWKAYKLYKNVNALDTDVFPSVKELQKQVIEKVGGLFSLPTANGYVSSGGTEGNIVAFWLGRKLTNSEKVVGPKSVHYSVRKACDLQQMDFVAAELGEDYRPDLEDLKEKIDDDTAVLVCTAGTTALGLVDPVVEMGEIAEDYDCLLHVDASFGGFVLPFLEDVPKWDFEVDQVSTITSDPDKMGLSPIPAGVFLSREEEWLDEIRIEAPYLKETEPTLLGTRPGGSIAGVWMVLDELVGGGYEGIVRECVDLGRVLADGIGNIDGLEVVVEPELNVVSFHSDRVPPEKIYQDLKEEGWLVSLNSEPESIRLVVMPHHESEDINSFLTDLEKYMEDV